MPEETPGVLALARSDLAAALSAVTGGAWLQRSPAFRELFPEVGDYEALKAELPPEGRRNILRRGDRAWEVLDFPLQEGTVLVLLHEVTYEMQVLARFRDQVRHMQEERQRFDQILNRYLPLGIMMVGRDCRVHFANPAMRQLFGFPRNAQLTHCFHYLRRLKACEDCPLHDGDPPREEYSRKKTFEQKGTYVTAELHAVGDLYLGVYQNTTRQIRLIQEIRKQQAELGEANSRISRQNQVLTDLTRLGIHMGRLEEVDAVLASLGTALGHLMDAPEGAVLWGPDRNRLEHLHFWGDVSPEKRRKWVGCWERHDPVPLSLVVPFPSIEGAVGAAIIHQPREEMDAKLVSLFLDQGAVYLQNLLLRRRLEEMAQKDGLTGVFNRRYLDLRLRDEIRIAQATDKPLSLMLVDVNGLKGANDRLGHEAGDLLIKGVARLLQENCSTYDSVFRLGGDEFVMLLTQCPQEQAGVMVEMLREIQTLSAIPFGQNESIPLRFSMGVATWPQDPLEGLLTVADQRMYDDKRRYYEAQGGQGPRGPR